jgi:hypothetical protein
LDESQDKSGSFSPIAKFKMPPGTKMLCAPTMPSVKTPARREDFGVRWQSAAATPLFDCRQSFQSGVALCFPPQSKKDLVAALPRYAFVVDSTGRNERHHPV